MAQSVYGTTVGGSSPRWTSQGGLLSASPSSARRTSAWCSRRPARVVTIDTDELLEIARNSLTRGFTEDECDRYKFDPCPTLEQVRSGAVNHG